MLFRSRFKSLLALTQMYTNGKRHSWIICLTSVLGLGLTLQFCSVLHPFQLGTGSHTHRCKAALTLSCKLSLCTAISINATISSFNDAAVFSIRSSQRLLCTCISAQGRQLTLLVFDSEPTFQAHKSNIIAKGMQVVLLKLFLRHYRRIPLRVRTWVIEQMHCDIVHELVIFREHYNDGDFKVMCIYSHKCL